MKPRFDMPRGEERAPRRAASLPLSPGKFDRILELARGKEVLDVGCVGGEFDVGLERTSHARLASVARSCVGIDIVPDQVERWREAGMTPSSRTRRR